MGMKIVADSSADMHEMADVAFASAPLKIITAEKEYVDDAALDAAQMATDLLVYKGKSSTSCPNTEDWLRAFGDAEEIFCVTITSSLSGSYNSACLAKAKYEELHPDRRVFVIDSLSAGAELRLIIEKLAELIGAGKEFDEICKAVTKYQQKTGLLFMLESMRNLANNGRVSPVVAKMAGILGIRAIGKASDHGTLEMLSKARGEKRALETIVEHMKALGYAGGKVRIAHCLNEGAAKALKEQIQSTFKAVNVQICKCGGLCSFYAEKGGMLIGFEKA